MRITYFVVICYNAQSNRELGIKSFTNSNLKSTAVVGTCLRGFSERTRDVTWIVKSDSLGLPKFWVIVKAMQEIVAYKQLKSGFAVFLNCGLAHLYICQVAEVTFNFWYRLSEALFKGEDEAKTALFRPYFESLFEALCVHCRLETDAVSTLLC